MKVQQAPVEAETTTPESVTETIPPAALRRLLTAERQAAVAQAIIASIGECFNIQAGDSVDQFTGVITRKATNEATNPFDIAQCAGDGASAVGTAEV